MDELLKKMFGIIQSEGIVLDYDSLNFSHKKLLGLYFYDHIREKSFIVLDKRLDARPILYKCVLAEELGHYFTVPRSEFTKPLVTYAERITLTRDEKRALTWAARFLVSKDMLLDVLARPKSIAEMAEQLGVTVEIMRLCLEMGRLSA